MVYGKDKKTLSIDIETFSSVDLLSTGVYPYVESSDFEVLLFAYAFDNDYVNVIDIASGEKLPEVVFRALYDENVVKTAFNANFEITCLSKFLQKPLSVKEWRCTMVHAAFLGLPGSLKDVSDILNLDKGKMSAGKSLIEYFSKPCKPTQTNGGRTRNLPEHSPDKWDVFKEYCKRDVEVGREIKNKLKFYKVPDNEWDLWFLDQKINSTGIQMEPTLIRNAIACDNFFTTKLSEEAKAISGLDNPNSGWQIKKWLSEKTGKIVKSIDKDSVATLMKESTQPEITRFLEIRKALAKTSVSKYTAMHAAMCRDGRLRGSLQFYGANRTGRWVGRLVQPHNLPKNDLEGLDTARNLLLAGRYEEIELCYGQPAYVLSQLIRTAFVPSKGNKLVIADFSAIEARVLAWFADEKWRIDVFKSHGKIYEASAAEIFKVPIDSITKGSELRQKGKIAELALGYQGGTGALIAMGALRMGLKEDDLQELVDGWRAANQNIVRFWYDVERAAIKAIEDKTEVFYRNKLSFLYKKGVLFISLPSGRKLSYVKAKTEIGGKYKRKRIVYEGINQTTRQWEQHETYGGKLVENIVQAAARDCLAYAMQNLDAAGYSIVLHVHDEAVMEVPKTSDSLQDISAIMTSPIPWAKDLPLRVDAFEADYYKKD